MDWQNALKSIGVREVLEVAAFVVPVLIARSKILYRKIWFPYFVEPAQMCRELREEVLGLKGQIAGVAEQMQVNGGSTLKDQLTRMEKEQSVMAVRHACNEERLRIIVMNSSMPTFECEPAGQIVFTNTAFLNLLNKQDNEVKGWNWVNFIHSDDRERVLGDWNEALNHKRTLLDSFRFYVDGKSVYVSFKVWPIFKGQTLLAWQGVATVVADPNNYTV